MLPPVYSLAATAVTFTLLQARTRRVIAHRRVFSAAANGLVLAAVSVLFHALPVNGRPWLWLLAAAGCAVLWEVASQALVISAVWLSDRTVSVRRQLLSRGALAGDAAEIAGGLVIAGAITGAGLILLVPALPLVVALQRSFRRTQLQGAARLDAQTGLLTPVAWRAEAEVQLARAQRSGAPLAVAIADLDHLQGVNTRYGYQTGDAVLAAAGVIVRASLRPYDLAGRFGGEEFVMLLPATTAGEALAITGQLRAAVAGHPVPAEPGQPPAHITASIGIAHIDDPVGADLTDLLATADAALYQAKRRGPDQVYLSRNQPGAPGPGTEATGSNPTDRDMQRQEIAAARRALGEQLAAARMRTQMSQRELGHRAGYSRSTIASAEAGEPLSGEFWRRVDRAVGAEGALIGGHARTEAAMTVARQRAARLAWWARTEPGGATADSGLIAVENACPSCGAALTLAAQVIAVRAHHDCT